MNRVRIALALCLVAVAVHSVAGTFTSYGGSKGTSYNSGPSYSGGHGGSGGSYSGGGNTGAGHYNSGGSSYSGGGNTGAGHYNSGGSSYSGGGGSYSNGGNTGAGHYSGGGGSYSNGGKPGSSYSSGGSGYKTGSVAHGSGGHSAGGSSYGELYRPKGNRTRTWSPQIVGGEEAPLGSVPHQVSLHKGGFHSCGGSIIANNFIVTAAHCCPDSSFGLSIYAGLNNIKTPEEGVQEKPVDQIIIHPNYTRGSLINDICILRLREPLVLGNKTRAAIIDLPPQGHSASGNATVTGWGAIYEAGPSSEKLLRVEVPIVTDEVCRENYASIGPIEDSMICAGRGGKDSCQGDSGGPLVDSNRYMVGIVSWGNGCARDGYPGVYTETSYFVEWIKQTLSQF